MKDRAIEDLSPGMQVLARKFLDLCADDPLLKDYRVFLTETYRGEAEQNADYAKGRDAAGKVIDRRAIVTNARYGQSAHNCTTPDGKPAANAFDFAIEAADGQLDWNAGDIAWRRAISIGTSIGLVSGISWKCGLKDCPHFELAHWRNT